MYGALQWLYRIFVCLDPSGKALFRISQGIFATCCQAQRVLTTFATLSLPDRGPGKMTGPDRFRYLGYWLYC